MTQEKDHKGLPFQEISISPKTRNGIIASERNASDRINASQKITTDFNYGERSAIESPLVRESAQIISRKTCNGIIASLRIAKDYTEKGPQ